MRLRIRALAGLALILALILAACAVAPANSGAEEGYAIYYLVPSEAAMGGDAVEVRYEPLELPEDAGLQEAAIAVTAQLLRGSSDGALKSPIPAGVELLSVTVDDRVARVDLGSGLSQLSGVDLVLADYCLTLSLTALEGISAVSLTTQGRPLGQQPKQMFFERDVLLSTKDDVLRTVEVTLYYANSEGALAPERRPIEIYEGQTLAENLVAALLEGPENRELTAVIPEGFLINTVRVENEVCYVNLSADSLAMLPEDSAAQQMILWSLADSIYSMETVEELRLLADGQELTVFGSVPVEGVATRPQG